MTACSFPSLTSKFPAVTSPWTQRRTVPGSAQRRHIRNPPIASRLAVQPTIDRPGPRIAGRRSPQGNRRGDRQGQLGGQFREPGLLLYDLIDVGGRTGESHQCVATQPKSSIVPAAGQYRGNGQIAPLRKLLRDELSDQMGVDKRNGLFLRRDRCTSTKLSEKSESIRSGIFISHDRCFRILNRNAVKNLG